MDIWQYTIPDHQITMPPKDARVVGINGWRTEHLYAVLAWLSQTYSTPTQTTWFVHNDQGNRYIVMTPPVYTMYTLKYSHSELVPGRV